MFVGRLRVFYFLSLVYTLCFESAKIVKTACWLASLALHEIRGPHGPNLWSPGMQRLTWLESQNLPLPWCIQQALCRYTSLEHSRGLGWPQLSCMLPSSRGLGYLLAIFWIAQFMLIHVPIRSTPFFILPIDSWEGHKLCTVRGFCDKNPRMLVAIYDFETKMTSTMQLGKSQCSNSLVGQRFSPPTPTLVVACANACCNFGQPTWKPHVYWGHQTLL
jgi:hypothetical protein